MPRTVLVAIVSAAYFGVLGLVVLVWSVATMALARMPAPVFLVFPMSLIGAVFAVIGLTRRRSGTRRFALAFSSGMAGGGLVAVVLFLATGVSAGPILGVAALAAPFAAAVWSLSRPSAKAWFASVPPEAHAGRR